MRTCGLRRRMSASGIWYPRSSIATDFPEISCVDQSRIPSPTTWCEEERSLVHDKVSTMWWDTNQCISVNYNAWANIRACKIMGLVVWQNKRLLQRYSYHNIWREDIAGLNKVLLEINKSTCYKKVVQDPFPIVYFPGDFRCKSIVKLLRLSEAFH